MSDKTQYTPPEADIERVLRQTDSDPRKLAVAYLRAQRRAKEANQAFGVSSDLNNAIFGIASGDDKAAAKALEHARRRMKQ